MQYVSNQTTRNYVKSSAKNEDEIQQYEEQQKYMLINMQITKQLASFDRYEMKISKLLKSMKFFSFWRKKQSIIV